jgi:hypothetical protein
LYLLDEKCYAVGVGIFSPLGTFALLAATFFAALAIDWVRVHVAFLCLSASVFAAYFQALIVRGNPMPSLTLTRLQHSSLQ